MHCPKIVPGQERLSPKQEAYARQFAQERVAAMLSTAAIDEREAEDHLRAAYTVAGLEPPRSIRWFESPIDFVMACVHRASVWDSVWDSVRASVGASVGASVWDSVRASVGASVRDSVGAYYDENWLAFYQFFHEVFEENKLIHLALFNEMVSGYRAGSQEAWLVRKPCVLKRDEQGRLHSASGMCMQYRDGWGFYAWHGVRVPERLILHPESITKEEWLHESNLEIRRVMQERLGNERFVALVGGKCIHIGKRGKLVEIDLGDDPERVACYVHVRDSSTEREYYLRVPPTISDADEGVAWTFGLSKESYRPRQEA